MKRATAIGVVLVLSATVAIGCGDGAERNGETSAAQRRLGTTKPATSQAAKQSSAKTAGTGVQTATTRGSTRSRTASALAQGTSAKPRTHHAILPAHPVPAAFEPAPGAASDAEVRSELAQMAAVERKQREQSLSAAAANLEDLLPWTSEPKSGNHVSVASVFTDYGLGLACGGVLGRNELGVAHKTAPCGTLITFTYGGRSLTVPVIDRGPYIAGREWDLTGATAAALGFPGLGKIEWALAQS
jgi:rare lipoprotein A (peptidoglycan hydrolase)